MRREALDGFGKTLTAFTYRGDSLIRTGAGNAVYEYVKQHGEEVNLLDEVMNLLVNEWQTFSEDA